MSRCVRCQKNRECVQTDEFGHFGDPLKSYCAECFVHEVKSGFHRYEIGDCTVCQQPLVLQYDDEETFSLAQDEGLVHYVCPELKAAFLQQNEVDIERLWDSHDELILYIIQPDPIEPDFG